jgi:spermidine synthase
MNMELMAVGSIEAQATPAAIAEGRKAMRWVYAFFFTSGFCSLLYELVWMRLAMAQFGVTSTLTATFLSLFMAGLGLGSWLGGNWVRHNGVRQLISPAVAYALIELATGIAALVVPHQLRWGHQLLLHFAPTLGWTSVGYSLLSGLWLALSVIPGCACMGATFPFGLSVIREIGKEEQRSFSYLYLANILGAMVGVTLPLLLIEQFGFLRTLHIAAICNFGIAVCALAVFGVRRFSSIDKLLCPVISSKERLLRPDTATRRMSAKWYLFAMGASSMGMETVWVRLFTPYLGTVIYAFAGILGIYLISTFIGCKIYRKGTFVGQRSVIWLAMGAGGFLAILTADPTMWIPRLLRLPLGVAVPAMVAGFATPMLVDFESRGDAATAGSAYAFNVLGCMAGPLISGFVLLPFLGERWTLVMLSAPWLVIAYFAEDSNGLDPRAIMPTRWVTRWAATMLAAVGIGSAVLCNGFEAQFPSRRVLRDSTATVVAFGESRKEKGLLVNGYGMSHLTAITKMMAHLPLAFVDKPKKILIVCFGMGTTYRSALSWNIDTTAVELTPSVPRLFSYFHPGEASQMKSEHSRVIIDDGRRFLERSGETYDVITVDPPPPVEAAGSSLLYSREFYEIAKRHLHHNGVLQQWIPTGDATTISAATLALTDSFPYVRAFGCFEGPGIHFLASFEPLAQKTGYQLSNHLPPDAIADLLEWGPETSADKQFNQILRREIPISMLAAENSKGSPLGDDRPVNEYFLMRTLSPVR